MNASSTASSRPPAPTIFIGNIPYDLTESALVELFKEVGPVKSFRLVNDRDTGMAKGYGFCEYYDTTTAESAVRNLNNHELHGRSIRVDFADEHVTKQVGSKSSVEMHRNATSRDDVTARQKEEMWMKDQPVGIESIRQAACKMAFLLGGRDVVLSSTPPTAGSNLQIYAILSEMTRKEMYELLAGMKDVVQRNYGHAKMMLSQNPQLSRTLFLIEIVLGIVEAPELPEESVNYEAYQEMDITQSMSDPFLRNVQENLQMSFPPVVLNPPPAPRPMQPMSALEQSSNSQMPSVMTGVIQTPLVTHNTPNINIQLQNPSTPSYGAATGLGFNNQESQVVAQLFPNVMAGVQVVAPGVTTGHHILPGTVASQNQILAVNQSLLQQPQPMVPMELGNFENEGDAALQNFSPMALTPQVIAQPQEAAFAISGDALDEQTKSTCSVFGDVTFEAVHCRSSEPDPKLDSGAARATATRTSRPSTRYTTSVRKDPLAMDDFPTNIRTQRKISSSHRVPSILHKCGVLQTSCFDLRTLSAQNLLLSLSEASFQEFDSLEYLYISEMYLVLLLCIFQTGRMEHTLHHKMARRLLALSLTLLAFSAVASAIADTSYEAVHHCKLSEELKVDILNEEKRIWFLNDTFFRKHELQQAVDCSQENDRILITAREIIRPQRLVVIPWSLEIEGVNGVSPEKGEASMSQTSFTCPSQEGLFHIRSPSFTLRNIIVRDCSLFENDAVGAIIEFSVCQSAAEDVGRMLFENVHFTRNRNLHGAFAFKTPMASCFTLKMDHVTFVQNTGILGASFPEKTTLTNVRLHQNHLYETPKERSAIFHFLSHSSSSLSNFYATNNIGSIIFSTESHLTLQDSLISKNRGPGQAALTVLKSSIKLKNSTFTDNRSYINGSALLLEIDSHALIEGSHFANNYGPYGAGIYGYNTKNIAIIDSTFEDNTAESSGGGIYLRALHCQGAHLPSLKLHNCIFLRNRALHFGGGLALKGCFDAVHITSSTWKQNGAVDTCANYVSLKGGGIALSEVTVREVELSQLVFEANDAYKGAGFAIRLVNIQDSLATLKRWDLEKQQHHIDVAFLVQGCRFLNNIASHSGGGMMFSNVGFFPESMYLHRSGRSLFETIEAATAPNPAWLKMDKCEFAGNEAQDNGGGLYYRSQECKSKVKAGIVCESLIIKETNFTENKAKHGGGVFAKGSAKRKTNQAIYLSNSKFDNNKARLAGAGTFIEHRDLINGCALTINSNTSDQNAGSTICQDMHGNAVRGGIYGANSATYAVDFRAHWVRNSTLIPSTLTPNTDKAHTFQLERGQPVPPILLTVTDSWKQPALLRASTDPKKEYPVVHASINNVGINEEQQFIPKQGAALITFAHPYLPIDNYTVEIRIPQLNSHRVIMLKLVVSPCQLNQQLSSNQQLPTIQQFCEDCALDQYSFYPETGSCHKCPDSSDCSSGFMLPADGYWNAFPCSPKLHSCLLSDACDAHRRLETLQEVASNHSTCQLDDDVVDSYQDALCTAAYKGALCGQCSKGYGRVGNYRCRDCVHWTLAVLFLFGTIIVAVLIAATLIGVNLVTGEEIVQRIETFLQSNYSRVIEMGSWGVSIFSIGRSTNSVDEDLKNVPLLTDSERAYIESAKWEFSELLKILLNFLQVLALATEIAFRWPRTLAKIMYAVDELGVSLSDIAGSSLSCLFHAIFPNHFTIIHAVFKILIPLIMIFAFYWFWSSRYRKIGKNVSYFRKRVLLTVIVVFYLAYPAITRFAVSTFHCVRVYDETSLDQVDKSKLLWALDTGIECFYGGHLFLSVLSILLIIVYCLGYPFFIFMFLLEVSSKDALSMSFVPEVFGFFFSNYKDNFVAWDVVIMLRKAFIIVFVYLTYHLGASVQGMFCVAVLIVAQFLQSTCKPYKKRVQYLNTLENISLLVSSMTYLAGIVLHQDQIADGTSQDFFIAIIIALNLVFILFMLAVLFNTAFVTLDLDIREVFGEKYSNTFFLDRFNILLREDRDLILHSVRRMHFRISDKSKSLSRESSVNAETSSRATHGNDVPLI